MSFQPYLDSIKAKTGKTLDDFRKQAASQGLTKYSEVVAWLKADYGLGHGHANAVAQLLVNEEKLKASPDDKTATHFAGDKVKWRKAYDALTAKITKLGPDVIIAPKWSYINVQRGGKKFAIIHPATAERFDIGIKLKGAATTERFQAAGSWNDMVTHRVSISDPKQIDAEVILWLKRAYEAAI
jgi:hypothetical protein